jgi:hypothetical protein
MRLNERLLNECEEFFDLIVNEEGSLELSDAIESLREFLEKHVDGWSNLTDEKLASAVQSRLMEIWGLIPRSEKAVNGDLKEYYDAIIYGIEHMDECAADDREYEEGFFDLEMRSPHVMDSQDLMYGEDE